MDKEDLMSRQGQEHYADFLYCCSMEKKTSILVLQLKDKSGFMISLSFQTLVQYDPFLVAARPLHSAANNLTHAMAIAEL